MCDISVKEVTSSDEPTENDHLHLQLPSFLRSYMVNFNSLFSSLPNFIVQIYFHHFLCVVLFDQTAVRKS